MKSNRFNVPKSLVFLGMTLALAACLPAGEEAKNDTDQIIRSVKTEIATLRPTSVSRYFPAILEPPELVPLAFEVAGRIADIDLRVGQKVTTGQALGTIEPVNLDLKLKQARAALLEAQTAADNAALDADRQLTLFKRGVSPAARKDQAVALSNQAKARLEQATANVEILMESRKDADLKAPFDGYINSVDVQDFASIKAGQPVITLYREGDLQATILVSFDVVETLSVADQVKVVPTDGTGKPINAEITEIGRRAAAVSSFPVVVTLKDATSQLRPGMAVEVQLDLALTDGPGKILLPLTAISTLHSGPFEGNPPFKAVVYIFKPTEEQAGTLHMRSIQVIAASGHSVFVEEGISAGDIVVTAGVPFLREGQQARLLHKVTASSKELVK